MLGFILNLIHIITGDIKAVIKWITSAIAAVYSFIDREIKILWTSLVALWRFAQELEKAAWAYILEVYNFARWIVDVVVANVIRWATAAIFNVLNFARAVYDALVRAYDYLVRLIAVTIHDIISWVIHNIWDPLFTAVTFALHWIGHEGAFVYYLLTHPDKLAALLAHYVWTSILFLPKRYARQIAKWLLHIMLSEAHDLADVLETIISALL